MAEDSIATAQEMLAKKGWCVIPKVLDSQKTKDVKDRLWAAAGESDRRGDSTRMARLDPNASNIRVFYLMNLDPVFRDLIQHPTAIRVVKGVFGENFLISNFTANIARPGSQSMGLHSDQSLICPDPWLACLNLNVIWCLDDCYHENGATLYIPGSHLWKTREDIPDEPEKLLIPFEAKAGSIICMDGRFVSFQSCSPLRQLLNRRHSLDSEHFFHANKCIGCGIHRVQMLQRIEIEHLCLVHTTHLS